MNETCHCGADMAGIDHCPCCGCEEHESVCDGVCQVPDGRPTDHWDTCWEMA